MSKDPTGGVVGEGRVCWLKTSLKKTCSKHAATDHRHCGSYIFRTPHRGGWRPDCDGGDPKAGGEEASLERDSRLKTG